jgi:hypothetical protein
LAADRVPRYLDSVATSPPHVIGFAAENIPSESWGKVWVAGYFPLDGVVDQRLRALESLWLAAEVASRRARGQTWPAEVRCLLISLPCDSPSRVWLNEEVELRGMLAWKWEPLAAGSPVAADDIVDLLGVELPQVAPRGGLDPGLARGRPLPHVAGRPPVYAAHRARWGHATARRAGDCASSSSGH